MFSFVALLSINMFEPFGKEIGDIITKPVMFLFLIDMLILRNKDNF